jgi:hypothetical protein
MTSPIALTVLTAPTKAPGPAARTRAAARNRVVVDKW